MQLQLFSGAPLSRAVARGLRLLLLACLMVGQFTSTPQAEARQPESEVQQTTPETNALTLLSRLTPEERVGQLFLVSFQGTDVSPESQIYDLVLNHFVGGVILRADNNNFTGPEGSITSLIGLVQDLQQANWSSTQMTFNRSDGTGTFTPSYIPMFVGMSQGGNGYPYDQLFSGLTTLPSQMTIGATWQPSLAEAAGQIVGRELSALGINMFIGPSLDLLESPNPESLGDLGTLSFGGDPFWVAKMAEAYITGVHNGSNNSMAVIATHFPGLGSANRPPAEEIPTIRRSLDQLQQLELAPFALVTGKAPTAEARADGLLVTHIRYQGLQGNIRATTRPISFDEQALSQILSLPEFVDWRTQGGVTVSDDLGTVGVRRLFDPEAVSFNARVVARDAFLAGNDLLMLGNIQDSADTDSYSSTVRIINFFVNRYNEDQAFATRVDAAVARILTLKYRLYETFSLNSAFPKPINTNILQQDLQTPFDIAFRGATLVDPPTLEELDVQLPVGPAVNDRFVIFTDVTPYQQCAGCPQQTIPEVDALKKEILRLYGPDGGGLTTGGLITPYTFEDLENLLNLADLPEMDTNLREAEWLVFLMRDIRSTRSASQALRRFLSERPELIRGKQIVVFTMSAPYYLDITDITKLSAYFALYSKTPDSISIAARILFREIKAPPGILPVSVASIGYELISATSPDPSQVIPLFLDLPAPEVPVDPSGATPTPEPTPVFRSGDLIPVRTGVIVDHNGNPVPDGTPVQFITLQGDQETRSPMVQTTDGVAKTTLLIPGGGLLMIRAQSEPATQSQEIQLEIPVPEIISTPEVTLTPTPSETPTPTDEPTPLPSETPAPVTEDDSDSEQHQISLEDWIIAIGLSVAMGILAYQLGAGEQWLRWRVRWGLTTLIGGLLAYTFLAVDSTWSHAILNTLGVWGILILVLTGAGLGLAVGMVFFLTKQSQD